MKRIFINLVILCIVILFISCGDDNPIESNPQPPEILSFTATPDKIVIGNQSTLDWIATNADSVLVNPGGNLFLNSDTGQTVVSPESNTFYTLIVFNKDGADTSSLEIQVASSFLLSSLNGDLFKAEMGTNQISPAVTFKLTDSADNNVHGEYITLEIIDGDGTLATDSILTDSQGEATIDYSFDGQLGYAGIKAKFSSFDSAQVEIRADMLRPGSLGQAQYILMTDKYSDVIKYNGEPDSSDLFIGESVLITVALYEASLGFVVLFYDIQDNDTIYDTSSIYGISVVDSIFIQPDNSTSYRYEGTTVNGIGIGSVYPDDIVPVYGEANIEEIDNTDPELSTTRYIYIFEDESEMTFWCNNQGSVVYQIDLFRKTVREIP
ncbi:MAG: hypothetical protein U9N54_07240 [candidate division Zixibacteria bacterium]|nr:hypothetical protein [candidate division Zixibacteria bacterium]